MTSADSHYMRVALNLARRGIGQTAPNPAVGCVLVKDSHVVGRGWTQPGGRPHAETEALRRAGDAAEGAIAYVTLEPCAHYGQTPPCADALVTAGIQRCVVACLDPDARVGGRGIARLEKAGISVETGLLEAESLALNAGYFLRKEKQRPLVTLKLATSLDGRIATHSGESQWITGSDARWRAHVMRAEHDGILVGIGTAIADNPKLDVRIEGLEKRSPLRVVLDSRLRLPLTHHLVARAQDHPTLLITRRNADAARADALRDSGVEVVEVGIDSGGYPAPKAVLSVLAERGINSIMVEGGAHVAADFLKNDLVDRLALFTAGNMIGGDGLPAVLGFGVDRLSDAANFTHQSQENLGLDRLDCFTRQENI